MVEPIADGFEFDLDHFTMAEKWKFNVASEPDSVPFLVKVVKKWPYSELGLDPTNVDDYGKLTQTQWDDVVQRFFRAIVSRRTQRAATN